MNQELETRPAVRPFRPESFGNFTLLAPLGAGGMGEVFLARSTFQGGLDRLCVIKRILPRLARDGEFVARFQDEVRTLLQLQHGSIAQVYDAGAYDGDYWIALEFVDGKDLRRLLNRMRQIGERLPVELALYVAVKVLEALAYAHRKKDDMGRELGLVHRDVSPQNILLSYEGEVKVIDFGLAESKLSTAKTSSQLVLGKVHYMAPEQARGDFVDRRSDLYAMGVVLWEMLVGKNPFEDAPPDEILQRVRNPSLPPIQTVDPALPKSVAAVVDRALSPEPFRRFATAEEMRARLSASLSEMAPDVGPEALGRWLTHHFREEYERERELLARLGSREDLVRFDPEGETQMVEAPEVDSGPLSAPTEIFHASSDAFPWPKRPYLPDEAISAPMAVTVSAPVQKRRRRPWLWAGALAAPLLVGVGWWAGSARSGPPAPMVPMPTETPAAVAPEVRPPEPPAMLPQPPTPPKPAEVAPVDVPVYGTGPAPTPTSDRAPAPRPRTVATTAPTPEELQARERAQILSRWRSLKERYERLVRTYGEERVGTIVEQLVEAARTGVERFVDHPEEYGKLEAQLEALSELVKEREDALR